MVSFTRNPGLWTNRKRINRFLWLLNISILFALFYLPCSAFGQLKRYEFAKGVMGSPFRLICYANDDSLAAAKAAQLVFDRLDTLNEILSDYRDGSEINRLSATSGSGRWIKVSDELFDILAISKKISRRTGGAFDVTVGPVVQLWRRAVRRNTFPSETEIATARRAVGYHYVKLRRRTKSVKLTRQNMRLDVGGIGKGYAAEAALKVLRGIGIKSALLDAGGDLTLGDAPPGKSGWGVEINSGSPDSLAPTLTLAHVGIATSGAAYRYLEHESVRYSHIVDPTTGVGLRFHVRTTVVAPNGTLADALATAFSVAGIKKARKMIRHFPGVEVGVLETKDGQQREWKTL